MKIELDTITDGIYSVEFITGRRLRVYPVGRANDKNWPTTTQCIIKKNGLIIGLGEVVKHINDKENPQYARTYAAKKAFKNADRVMWRELREKLWYEILKEK